ncbi:hypothetical protein Hypma_016167 [Hypsizygus marmoreus]|uniref:Uncharacterized protein n=1 Tax=Hypsizygus marmoreus TaxID=39966 RepID=A0A369J660_HYPMA|nr:hypothetical protein Hypma_016167 [Hypsizygus marmoreus]
MPEFYAAPADREMPAYSDIQFDHELYLPSWHLRVPRKEKCPRTGDLDEAVVEVDGPNGDEALVNAHDDDEDFARLDNHSDRDT